MGAPRISRVLLQPRVDNVADVTTDRPFVPDDFEVPIELRTEAR